MTAITALSWLLVGIIIGLVLAALWHVYFYQTYPDRLLQEYMRRTRLKK